MCSGMNDSFGFFLQITATSVRLVTAETKKLVQEWRPPSGKNISVASCNSHQVCCAVGSDIFYLEIEATSINQVT